MVPMDLGVGEYPLGQVASFDSVILIVTARDLEVGLGGCPLRRIASFDIINYYIHWMG